LFEVLATFLGVSYRVLLNIDETNIVENKLVILNFIKSSGVIFGESFIALASVRQIIIGVLFLEP